MPTVARGPRIAGAEAISLGTAPILLLVTPSTRAPPCDRPPCPSWPSPSAATREPWLARPGPQPPCCPCSWGSLLGSSVPGSSAHLVLTCSPALSVSAAAGPW